MAAVAYKRTRGGDYGYSNARVRGMRSKLLPPAFYDDLMLSEDLHEMIRKLSSTGYGPDLEATLVHGYTAGAVDEALKANLVGTCRKVLAFAVDEARLLLTTLLGWWDLFNIKTIIRGKHMQLASDEIHDSLLAAGQLSQVELDELNRCTDVRQVVDTLATWEVPYGTALRQTMAEYARSENLSLLELALDRQYASWAAGLLDEKRPNFQVARRALGAQIDSINLVTSFRLLRADLDESEVERFFLEGGEAVDKKLFLQLAGMSDIDEVLDALKRTPYGPVLDEAAAAFLESNSIAVLERALENQAVRKILASGRGDPLGVGIIIAYVWAKQNEVTNLRIVMKGKSVGMPVDRIRRELIVA